MMLNINEIFHSIQGESTYAGMPCTFIRLTGCNLRCSYCDTQYAYHEGRQRPIPDILKQVSEFQCRLVEVTGGEPLMQENTPQLIALLIQKGFTVLMETNGSMDIRRVDPRCVRIMDIKCPSSNEHTAMDFNNLGRLTAADQLKFVISDHSDYCYARKIVKEKCGHFPMDHILFSPVFGKINPRELAEWILQDHLQVRLQVQLHKIIWHADQRGV